MNVWWINHVALPPTDAGGTRHFSFARKLNEEGHNVSVIAASFHDVRRKESRLEPGEQFRVEQVAGVRFLWIRTPPYDEGSARRVWSWLVFAIRLWNGTGLSSLPEPNVVIGSSPYPFAALAAERLARRAGVPFVLEIRDLWPETLIRLGNVSRWHPFVWTLSALERYLYQAADHIVTVLPRGKDYMVPRGADRERVSWIPNAVDLAISPEPSPPRQADPLTIMYAGSHGLSNTLNLLLDAARILQREGWNDRVQFHLVGDGPLKPELMEKARSEGLENVQFFPPVSKVAIYEVLSSADAFVLLLSDSPLYQWGASPQKLFDYMAAARPILLGSDTSWDPVGEAECGITVSTRGAPEVAEGVRRLASLSPAERRRMGERARRYVKEHHDLSALSGKLETLLSGLVQARSKS